MNVVLQSYSLRIMKILATVRNIQPKAPKPMLELAFARADSGNLARGHKVRVTLLLEGDTWHGTMRNDGTRDAYVHTWLENDQGVSATCTEVLARLGIGHNARLQFHVVSQDALRLDEIAQSGESHSLRPANVREASRPPRASHPAGARKASTQTPSSQTAGAFPFDDCGEIRRLAEAYWDLITPAETTDERRFEHDFAEARRQRFISKDLFVRVGRWKSVRQTQNYESNSAGSVRTATAEAFEAADDAIALAALTQLRGVALRTASAILHWMRPDQFPILDVRVVSALGWAEPKSWDDVSFYARASERVRELARHCSVDLRTMDRALWAWDKLRSRGRS